MKKTVKLLCVLLCLALLRLPVQAGQQELVIRSREDLLAFAENCRLDTYSQGLTVRLEADLQLDGTDFQGIPIFCGEFLGNHHTISGLQLRGTGTALGFFRYLTDTASVQGLNLQGSVTGGSTAGGLAGVSRGRVVDCSFRGQVSGTDRIGGLLGSSSGSAEKCRVTGTVFGNHFVGGIAGENLGVLKKCTNLAQVNTQVRHNQVDISDITLQNLSGTESAATATDIGGIAGTNSGVIRGCENCAPVGYPHMGYNVGGIAGSHMGYMEGCRNYAPVQGRKEVGGIIGQMEPVSRIAYDPDTLQILQQQLADTSAAASLASYHARENSSQVTGQIRELQSQADAAREAAGQLMPQSGRLPEPDQALAALNTLGSSLTGMQRTVTGLAGALSRASADLVSDVQALSGHLNAMSSTLDQAPDHLGARLTDISDQDTPEDLTGKAENCENSGSVLADLNAGGIAGALAVENDLDPEDDLQFLGDASLNFTGEVRAVLRNCRSSGPVSAKKRSAGGIAGKISLGLVTGCVNTGTVSAPRYAGGIAGTSQGFVRLCSAKCALEGENAVGGIAGAARLVTDCRSMVMLPENAAQSGAVTGQSGGETYLGNLFLASPATLGGIDGISYGGQAEPLPLDAFLALPELDPVFLQARITFRFPDGKEQTLLVPTGGGLTREQLPPLPAEQNSVGSWQVPEGRQLSRIFLDLKLEPVYESHVPLLESSRQREPGVPLALAQGSFPAGEPFPLEEAASAPEGAAEQWVIPELPGITHLRCTVPGQPDRFQIRVHSGSGWRTAETRVSGRYLVFPVEPGDDAFCAVPLPENYPFLPLLLLLPVLLLLFLLLHKRRHSKK